ncbi:hypothetical protein Bca52824_053937 [Brassica carinata]|uniref:Uncharacterized protein n=1 Tax=Brassica carinata TaxID=52824 RepID=A0A8X7R7I3_BRACI|nr:hypothetical protein Bca52824_053937 [Brassica carinata]
MANSRFFFSDLKSGKCTSVVEARLLRFWEARNVKRSGELMWVANCRPNILCLWPSNRGYDNGLVKLQGGCL